MNKKHKDYKPYPIKSFRLDKRTLNKLEQIKKKENISWNRVLYKLTKLYVHETLPKLSGK